VIDCQPFYRVQCLTTNELNSYPIFLSPNHAAIHMRLLIIIDHKREALWNADGRRNFKRSARW
jgi:hypothetical protein